MYINTISSINMQGRRNNSGVNAGNTGAVAALGLTAAAVTAFSKNKNWRRSHKYFGLIALVAMVAHVWKVTSWHRN